MGGLSHVKSNCSIIAYIGEQKLKDTRTLLRQFSIRQREPGGESDGQLSWVYDARHRPCPGLGSPDVMF